jgi:hypothetical protein
LAFFEKQNLDATKTFWIRIANILKSDTAQEELTVVWEYLMIATVLPISQYYFSFLLNLGKKRYHALSHEDRH